MATIYKKMNPDYKKAWLEALRSGRYKQTKRKLKAPGKGLSAALVFFLTSAPEPLALNGKALLSFSKMHFFRTIQTFQILYLRQQGSAMQQSEN